MRSASPRVPNLRAKRPILLGRPQTHPRNPGRSSSIDMKTHGGTPNVSPRIAASGRKS
jgi:hypothetical protein